MRPDAEVVELGDQQQIRRRSESVRGTAARLAARVDALAEHRQTRWNDPVKVLERADELLDDPDVRPECAQARWHVEQALDLVEWMAERDRIDFERLQERVDRLEARSMRASGF